MHNKSLLSIATLAFVLGLSACTSGGHNDSRSVSSSGTSGSYTITTQCDTGSSINPTSVQANAGDTPSFDITLQSGYSIQTIYCTSGGTLVGNHFTLGSVQGSDNVHVVTGGRYVGSVASPALRTTHDAENVTAVRSLSGTTTVSANANVDALIAVRVVASNGDERFLLRYEDEGKCSFVPLVRSDESSWEARFALSRVAPHFASRDMLSFDVIEDKGDGAERSKSVPCAKLFVSIAK